MSDLQLKERYVRKHKTYRLESWLGLARIFGLVWFGLLVSMVLVETANMGFWILLSMFAFSGFYYFFSVSMYIIEWRRIAGGWNHDSTES